jgi:hypothetical protein
MRLIKYLFFLFICYFLADYSFGQNTFKKVFTGFSVIPYNYKMVCKPNITNESFLIGAGRLLKINSYGDLESTKEFLSIGGTLNSFVINDDGSIYLLGNYNYNKNLTRLDTFFNVDNSIIYNKINGPGYGKDRNIIIKTIEKHLVFSGGMHDTTLFVKSDSTGDIIWGKYFVPNYGGINDIIQTQDSGFIIASNFKNAGACLIKTDKNGNVLWAKSYFRPRGYIHNVLENDDRSLIITGNTDSLYAGTNSSPLFFAKLDQYGNVLWAKTFGDANNNIMNYPTDTKHTQDGGYITLATQANPIPNEDIIMIKLDANGDTLWVRAHGSPNSWDYGQSIEQLNDKGYIICGSTNNNIPVSLSSLYIVRTDSLGHTDSLCEEYSLPLAINNISVNDSDLTVTSVPFTITTSIPDTSTQNFTTYAYDGCHLDAIPELYAEQTATLLIYPNPTDGAFVIEAIMNSPLKTEIEIYDINSRRIYTGTTTESVSGIDLTRNARGLYFVKLSNERWVKTGKMMIE